MSNGFTREGGDSTMRPRLAVSGTAVLFRIQVRFTSKTAFFSISFPSQYASSESRSSSRPGPPWHESHNASRYNNDDHNRDVEAVRHVF